MRLPAPTAPATPSWRGGVCGFVPLAVAALALAGCAHHDYARYEPKPLDPAKTAAALEARTLDDPGLRKFLTENLHKDFSVGKPVEWDFETLCWVAFYFNPTLDVARAQCESARAAQTTAAARPNPSLTLTPGFSANPNGASPWLPAVGLDFAIDPAAQRDRRAEVARLNAEAARQAVFAAAWSVRGELRCALLDWALAGNRKLSLHAQVEAQQKILSLLERRREAGAGTAAESAAARLTLIKVETVAAETERQILLVRQHIGRVLGLSATSLKGVYLLPESATPQSLENKNLPDVRRQSLQTRADVLSALAHYAVAESALALEAERQHPGLHLGPGYQWDQGQNKWTVAFTFELLLFNRNEGPLAEAEAHRHEAAAQLAAIQAQVLAEIESAAAAQTAATEQIASLERVNTEEKKQLALVEARQRAGVSDQLDVQNARLEFATAELALIEGEVQAGISAGQLEDALQIPLANLDALAPAEPAQGVTVSKPQP